MSRDADFLVSEAVLRRSMPWRLQNQHRLHFTQTHLSIDGIPGAGLALIENDRRSVQLQYELHALAFIHGLYARILPPRDGAKTLLRYRAL